MRLSCVIFDLLRNRQSARCTGLLGAAAIYVGFSATALADNPFQRTGNLTSQPIGHYEYCRQNVPDCSIRTFATKPRKLTQQTWQELQRINRDINAQVAPRTDMEIYGVEEHWTLPTDYGDCEDYVLAKRRALISLGWPAHTLLATVVLRPNGEGHAVLTVRTDRGDYVLDNLKSKVTRWDDTEYRFLKRVASSHSGRWEDILDSRNVVASITRAQ